MNIVNNKLRLPLLLFLFYSCVQGQPDTLSLTIKQAEKLFLKNNLQLLASKFNMDINQAWVAQAKVWDNPTILLDQNIYDGKFFRHATENGQPYGQIYLQAEQLVRTAGKIKKQTKLAEDNVLGAEAQFNDLMRNLKYTLTTDMNTLAQYQNNATLYNQQISSMQTLAAGMDKMLVQGDISQKENIRIKALLFSLQNDQNENLRSQLDLEKEIRTLLYLHDDQWVISVTNSAYDPFQVRNLDLKSIQDSAINTRPDIMYAKAQSRYQYDNIALQKALAKPDVGLSLEYDHLNSYVPNYFGMSIALPIPLFNKNRGNIAAAAFSAKQSDVLLDQTKIQVQSEVQNAYQKLISLTNMLNDANVDIQSKFDSVAQNMLKCYLQRQVSLIEFIDFFETYKDTRVREWQLETNQRNAAAELNYVTNKNLIQF